MIKEGPENLDDGMTRRDFLVATGALGATMPFGGSATEHTIDPNLSVFLSDTHVPGDGVVPDKWEIDFTAMESRLKATVAEILEMDPRPANVVVFGDICYLRGEAADYVRVEPIFRRLARAGVRVVLGLGNHDRREPFLAAFPEYRTSTLVPGEVVSRVSLGSADLILLDTLDESNRGKARISPAQERWMRENLPVWERPFFLGGHHRAAEVPFGNGPLEWFVVGLEKCRGYVHGHWHTWQEWTMFDWGRGSVKRAISLPSTGFWGDIGYVRFRTSGSLATATLVQKDFYFPRHQPDPAKRDPMWAVRVRENNGRTVHFAI